MVPRLPALTRRPLAVLTAAAALVAVGQVAIQWGLARQRATQAAIGVVARHRIVAVRLTREALVAGNDAADPATRAAARAEWQDAARELEALRRGSGDGDAMARVEGRLLPAAAALVDGAPAARPSAVAALAAADRDLARVSLDVWGQLHAALNAQSVVVRRVEAALALVVLLTLALGAALVVRPAARASERLMAALLASRARLQAARGAMLREREFATAIVHSAADAMFAFDGALRITAWNPAMEEWTGVARADAVGRRPEEIAAELDWGAAGRPYGRALAGETVVASERPGRASPDGPVRLFDATCGPVRAADGTTAGGLVSVRDVTERVRAAERVRRSEARFRTLFDQAPLGIVLLDQSARVVDANGAFAALVGRDAAALRGVPAAALHADEDAGAVDAQLRALREGRTDGATIERRLARPDGRAVWASLTVCRLDAAGERATLVGMALDVTERRELETRLSHQAFHDPLTGLANRARLRDRLERALADGTRDPRAVALMYVDLDDFKRVNDSFGHAAGDRLLREVADRLLGATRGSDTVARLGGDEFAILLGRVRSDADAVVVAERVSNAMRAPFALEGRAVRVGASVGVARAVDSPDAAPLGADALLRNADAAMYQAKRDGKGRYALYRQPVAGEVRRARDGVRDTVSAVGRAR